MTATFRMTLAALVAGLWLGASASADSIWAKAGSKSKDIYRDDTAKKVGDILTIVISERSTIDNQTTRDGDKKSTRTAAVAGGIKAMKAADTLTGDLFNTHKADLNAQAETKFEGSSKYDTNRSITDQVTVVVQDVQPNGNLVVLGTRTREAAGDTQIIQVSGIVRPSDIAFDNTVRSERVADFNIVHKTRGTENRFTEPGWLDRILNWLNPF